MSIVKRTEAPVLVFVDDKSDGPFTTSDIIAEHTEHSYRSIQRTIENQIERLERFGQVRFEITPVRYSRGTNMKKVYHLNEPQATLLITFLKNTDVVADFKVELVRQFFEMRRQLQERQSVQWQQARIEGKVTRRMEADAVKAFAQYAAASGSRSPEHYYIHFTRMAHKAIGTEDGQRDNLSTAQLLNLRMAEQVIDRAIWQELSVRTEYHTAFRNVKARVQQFAGLALLPKPAMAPTPTTDGAACGLTQTAAQPGRPSA